MMIAKAQGTAIFVDCPAFLDEIYVESLAHLVPDLAVNVGEAAGEALVKLLEGYEIAINDHSYFPREVLAACPDLKAIVFMGTGASSFVDMDAAAALEISVRTFGGYGDRSIAEHAVGLMFAAGRQIAAMDRVIRAGNWETRPGIEFLGKKLGVVGTGGIGREMVALGNALGMEVLAWNRSGVPPDLNCRAMTLDDLLGAADVVSLHLALNSETEGIINAKRLALLQPHALLINTARGALVDETALIAALRGHRLGHAALDVFEREPLAPGHPFTTLDNVTLTAHGAFMTREASERMYRTALELVIEERKGVQTNR